MLGRDILVIMRGPARRLIVRGLLLALLVLPACGRIGFEPGQVATADGGSTDGSTPDGDADISELGPFGTPMPVDELASAFADEEPTFTADRLEMYFASNRFGTKQIWRSTRGSATAAWETPGIVGELSTGGGITPAVSPDGLTLYFASTGAGGGTGFDIFVTTRASRSEPWSAPVRVDELSSSAYDGNPGPSADGLTMLITSTRDGSEDLYISTRASVSEPWGVPVPLEGVNTASSEGSGRLVRGELELWFHSDRPGGVGDFDLYVATRATKGDAFSAPRLVTELLSTANDWDVWVSEDARYVMFASNRDGQYAIYEASR